MRCVNHSINTVSTLIICKPMCNVSVSHYVMLIFTGDIPFKTEGAFNLRVVVSKP